MDDFLTKPPCRTDGATFWKIKFVVMDIPRKNFREPSDDQQEHTKGKLIQYQTHVENTTELIPGGAVILERWSSVAVTAADKEGRHDER
jgi:hypothetical protein